MPVRSSTQRTFAVCIVTLLLVFAGCATTLKENKVNFSPDSMLNQAEVVVKNSEEVEVFRGFTPAIVEIPREGEYSVSLWLPDYKEQRSFISKDNSLDISVVSADSYSSGGCDSGSSGDCCDSGSGSGGDCDCNSLSGIGLVRFGMSRVISPLRHLSPDHIAVNLVSVLSDQNTNEPYAVFHTFNDGDVKTLTVPLMRR